MRFPFDIPPAREFDAVGFGLNAVDHLVVVEEYPAFDTKTRFLEHATGAGGQTASAMVALRRLGWRTAYAGRFGSDAEGRFGLQTLIDAGVEVSRAQVVAGARTQTAYIVIEGRTGERTIIWDRDERLAYRADEAPADFAARGRVLHLDAHDPLACAALAREARAAGTVVSADVDNVYPGLEELLPLIDVLVSSAEFPRRLTGIADERAALVEVKSRLRSESVVGMTLGARGAVLFHEGRYVESPALPVPGACRDTTGAGDAFHAGLLHAMLSGASIEDSLRAGCAVAALNCRRLGARAGLPTREELAKFVER
ncbi:MAG: PfkB family carbohydrate kinase [Acidobacteria bacterium]|nr:PfkB family carbohydrate kinase [Acidobacteriota bacterium]